MKLIRSALTSLMACVFVAGCASYPNIPGADVADDGTYIFKAEGTAIVMKPGEDMDVAGAKLAAETMARANLLKKIKGVYLTENITVADLLLQKQAARSETSGWLSRADVVCDSPEGRLRPKTVRATATLRLSREEIYCLKEYVE